MRLICSSCIKRVRCTIPTVNKLKSAVWIVKKKNNTWVITFEKYNGYMLFFLVEVLIYTCRCGYCQHNNLGWGFTHMTCFCFSLKGANTELISVPSVVNGIKGKPLYVAVETKFNEEGVRFQGTWFQLSPKFIHLVTFNNNGAIHNMLLKETVERITPPIIALNFTSLDEADEGDYQLMINIIHIRQNKSETVTKNVRITVNGKNGFTSLTWQLTWLCHFFPQPPVHGLYVILWELGCVFWFCFVLFLS